MRIDVKASLGAVFLFMGGTLAAYGQVLKTKDVSPDQSNFTYALPSGSNPAGRIESLVIDPNNDAILYAGAEISGVWKTTTGFLAAGPNFGSNDAVKMKWFQASNGLRNGFTMNQYSLAVDPASKDTDSEGRTFSKRLLYASGDMDGRPGHPDGGLWVSIDAAANWSHVALCGADIGSVIFSGGQPFVSTSCGIWTTTSADLISSWTKLTTTKIKLGNVFLADGANGTFFACRQDLLFPVTNLGRDWGQGVTLPGNCLALASVPNGSSASTQALVVRSSGTSIQEVTLVNFGESPATTRDLGFGTFSANNGGSGVMAVSAVTRTPATGPLSPPGPGATFDVFAADSCAWFEYYSWSGALPIPTWQMVVPAGGSQCYGGVTNIHADTWAMVFPSWYDSGKGVCAAYAATDGGVFFTGGSTLPGPTGQFGAGCATTPWLPAQSGLHVLKSQVMAAITQGAMAYSPVFELALYLPTGDNDVFVGHLGNCFNSTSPPGCVYSAAWQDFDALGDAGQALSEPFYPQQVLISRNDQGGRNYVTVNSPPLPAFPPYSAGTKTQIIEPSPPLPKDATFDDGYHSPGTDDLALIMTPSSEYPVPHSLTGPTGTPPLLAIGSDYLAVQDDSPKNEEATPPSGCDAAKHDHVLRNASGVPPDPLSWHDLSDFFLACDIMKVLAAGGHQSPTIYVLTNSADDKSSPAVHYPAAESGQTYGPGSVYKGSIIPGTTNVSTWLSVMGSKENPLKWADDFFVNPYDPNELYAVDTKDQAIMYTRNGGKDWYKDETLTDIATNHGEYEVGCNSSVGRPGESGTDPFTDSCAMSGVAFDPYLPQARAAALLYGGIAFSRDYGHHWMALDVTNNNHFLSDNLTDPVVSVYLDAETLLPDVPFGDAIIYAALHGHSLLRVAGPFQTIQCLNFTFNPAGTACAAKPPGTEKESRCVSVVIPAFSQTIELHKDSDGLYHGSALFNVTSPLPPLEYYFLINGKTKAATGTYTLTGADYTNGVATTPEAP